MSKKTINKLWMIASLIVMAGFLIFALGSTTGVFQALKQVWEIEGWIGVFVRLILSALFLSGGGVLVVTVVGWIANHFALVVGVVLSIAVIVLLFSLLDSCTEVRQLEQENERLRLTIDDLTGEKEIVQKAQSADNWAALYFVSVVAAPIITLIGGAISKRTGRGLAVSGFLAASILLVGIAASAWSRYQMAQVTAAVGGLSRAELISAAAPTLFALEEFTGQLLKVGVAGFSMVTGALSFVSWVLGSLLKGNRNAP